MIISQTPLRISLLGGNTDFPKYYKEYGGACLTTTIDKYIYCIVKKRFDDEIWINYSKKEKVDNVNKIKHDIVREAMRMVGVGKGIEITFLSDIPSEGSGLGSSSAVAVGVLNALHTYIGENVTAGQLATEACHLERHILKKPIGEQDQYAVAFGGFILIDFQKDKTGIVYLDPEELSDHLMLFYTGITRKAEKILSKMKLNIKILDEIKLQTVKKLDHITDAVIMGEQMNRYWVLKRMLNKSVTNRKIDKMYMKALNNGALGGKIVGAGGGGFLLLAVLPRDQAEVRALGWKELKFNFTRFGSRIIFNTHE